MSDRANVYEVPDTGDVMPCHAQGEKPEGYDAEEEICQDCLDKFSCLPVAIANPEVWTSRKAKVWAIGDDAEVAALTSKTKTYAQVRDQLDRRAAFRKKHKLIPPELLTRPRPLAPAATPAAAQMLPPAPVEKPAPKPRLTKPTKVSPAPAPLAPAAVQTDAQQPSEGGEQAAETSSDVAGKKTTTKKKLVRPSKPVKASKAAKAKKSKPEPKKAAPKKKAAAKPASKAKPAVKNAEKPKPVKPAKAETKKAVGSKAPPPKPRAPRTAERKVAKNGKALPAPQTITKEQMLRALDKVRLGVKVDWEWGMQIVRKGRGGEEFVVTVTENGFLYDGEHYASLSSAAQNASGTPCRSGNDWFNLLTASCTEVRDAKGKVIASKNLDL